MSSFTLISAPLKTILKAKLWVYLFTYIYFFKFLVARQSGCVKDHSLHLSCMPDFLFLVVLHYL